MSDYTEKNRIAWEYDAYNFWVRQAGLPSERAKQDVENPRAMLKRYADYFNDVTGLKIANICGSCGKKAVPLALLGAEVTVFDISEQNKRYACETAEAAGTNIQYIVGDVLNADMSTYEGYFDIVFMEGGILHYFHDINQFMEVMYRLCKSGGQMICSDFHPFQKIIDVLKLGAPSISYFSTEIVEGEMAHAKFYDNEIQRQFPKCSLRRYNLSEIINAVLYSGFVIRRFDEHPAWTDEKMPGEFTILSDKV